VWTTATTHKRPVQIPPQNRPVVSLHGPKASSTSGGALQRRGTWRDMHRPRPRLRAGSGRAGPRLPAIRRLLHGRGLCRVGGAIWNGQKAAAGWRSGGPRAASRLRRSPRWAFWGGGFLYLQFPRGGGPELVRDVLAPWRSSTVTHTTERPVSLVTPATGCHLDISGGAWSDSHCRQDEFVRGRKPQGVSRASTAPGLLDAASPLALYQWGDPFEEDPVGGHDGVDARRS